MELRQLQYFLAIASTTSLSKASSVLGVAQPALSRQLQRLEKELGKPLFYRHGRGIRLTSEGLRFREAIAPLIHDLLRARADLANETALAGPLSFGMPPSISALIGARLIRSFLDRFPDVVLHIISAFSGYLNELLVDGRFDVAVINNARRSAQIYMDPLLELDVFHIASRKCVPPCGQDEGVVAFDEVAADRLMLPGRHHGLRREMETVAREQGLKLDVFVEVDSLSVVKELVRSGVGSTVLPHGAILTEFDDPAFVIRRVTAPDVVLRFMIAYARSRPITPAMVELTRMLKEHVDLAIAEGRLRGRRSEATAIDQNFLGPPAPLHLE
ncbi:LysR family transcriptional regulator [Pseudochelatococcus sp. B33]